MSQHGNAVATLDEFNNLPFPDDVQGSESSQINIVPCIGNITGLFIVDLNYYVFKHKKHCIEFYI